MFLKYLGLLLVHYLCIVSSLSLLAPLLLSAGLQLSLLPSGRTKALKLTTSAKALYELVHSAAALFVASLVLAGVLFLSFELFMGG